MTGYSIYIVDDEETIRAAVTMALESDYQVKAFAAAESAIETMKDAPPDLVLLDIGLPGMDGIEALGKMKALCPDVVVIMITAFEDVETVISAMKLGAYDYVVKPLHMDALELNVQNALESMSLRKEVLNLQVQYLKENLPCIVGESSAILDVMEFIGMVAKSPDTPILLVGETGTGKELMASAIHYRSPNFKGPFTTVNCAAIPKDLIESELFGYDKGAFSGARAAGKKGLVEEAANGTLFLDEVGDLSLDAQAKLLRFLEDGEFYKIGGTKKLHIQTRVVSATNKNLENMINEDQFRRDLYFRLGVIKIQIPSLNERRDDIVPIARHYLFEFSTKFGKKFNSISSKAKETLMEYHWTGHVRELKNMIERAVLIGKGPELSLQDLDIVESRKSKTPGQNKDEILFPPLTDSGVDLASIQETLEKFYFEKALSIAGGNESQAAKLLNMNHHTFRYRRKKLFKQ
jgi:DNA-binding NtrC family response regulator